MQGRPATHASPGARARLPARPAAPACTLATLPTAHLAHPCQHPRRRHAAHLPAPRRSRPPALVHPRYRAQGPGRCRQEWCRVGGGLPQVQQAGQAGSSDALQWDVGRHLAAHWVGETGQRGRVRGERSPEGKRRRTRNSLANGAAGSAAQTRRGSRWLGWGHSCTARARTRAAHLALPRQHSAPEDVRVLRGLLRPRRILDSCQSRVQSKAQRASRSLSGHSVCRAWVDRSQEGDGTPRRGATCPATLGFSDPCGLLVMKKNRRLGSQRLWPTHPLRQPSSACAAPPASACASCAPPAAGMEPQGDCWLEGKLPAAIQRSSEAAAAPVAGGRHRARTARPCLEKKQN